jgi:ferritin-like metal-binding protein YciE
MATDTEITHLLRQAHAMEAALVTTLQAHHVMTPEGSYRALLERHIDETRAHAAAIEQRLADAGAERVGLLDAALGLVQTVAGQLLALSKGPIDLLRGGSIEEKLLRNARDECASEAFEIATYDELEAAARAVSDADTAELAARHRQQEERMLADLRRELPGLAVAAVVGAGAQATDRAFGASDRGEPFPDYDLLSAGQVIRRLPTLSPAELDAIEAYERAHRGRSTVLRRIEDARIVA